MEADIPQPPKQTAYSQPSNPVSRNPQEEQREQPTTQRDSSSSIPGPEYTGRQYGDAPAAIHRTAESKPSSDENLAQLEQEHSQKVDPEGKRGHIDLEYGIEQQPSEGYIATAVHGNTENTPRVQPGAHAGPVGSTPGYEQDTAAQMDRKRTEHDHILGEDGGSKSPAYYGEDVDVERRRVRENKLKSNEELDVKSAVKNATGNVTV
ncbi:hypothetical protein UA08_06022 [Talaromyces atroroseus]|uniref:Uncharacterized protein n=1 Tax=Talaromyces atroroseus TaxID=1441469 RepID=A0A225AYW3_TALAT|nr:hypothetical protein UA08_06022 [Talaromyces atroroseus]OKL58697.1 hypothetical protein UA08_06022 [Talaromyces atroroseus]